MTKYRSIVLVSDEGDTLELYVNDTEVEECLWLVVNGSDTGSDGESFRLGRDGLKLLVDAVELLRNSHHEI